MTSSLLGFQPQQKETSSQVLLARCNVHLGDLQQNNLNLSVVCKFAIDICLSKSVRQSDNTRVSRLENAIVTP